MKKSLLIASVIALFFLIFNCLSYAQITIDGNMFDWTSGMQLDVAPNVPELTFDQGDDTDPPRGSTNPNYFVDLDIKDVYGICDNNYVYIRITMNPAANVTNIYNDTSYHGGGSICVYISIDPGAGDSTGLTYGWWGNGYDFFAPVYPPDPDFATQTGNLYQQALYENKQTGNDAWNFEVKSTTVGVKVAWNATNNDVECAIPKSLLLNPKYLNKNVIKSQIAIMIYAGENDDPWRADYASNPNVTGYLLNLNPTGVNEKISTIPVRYKLEQNYPNPFNPSTTINYSLPESGVVKVKVYNLMGQELKTLVNTYQQAGNYSVRLDAKDFSSGVYFYNIDVNNYREIHKMIVLK